MEKGKQLPQENRSITALHGIGRTRSGAATALILVKLAVEQRFELRQRLRGIIAFSMDG
jgi:hypothetical protein